MVIDTILFDNWNTLVQAPDLMKPGASTKIISKSLQDQGVVFDYNKFVEVYRSVYKKQLSEVEANEWKEFNYIERLKETLTILGIENNLNLLCEKAWQDYLNEWPVKTSFFPESLKILNALKQNYKLGLVTNFMDGPVCRQILSNLNYSEIFNSLIISAEIGYQKPSPILFRHALVELKSKPQNCVMVGDTYNADIVGAHNAGIKGILIDVYDNQQEHYPQCDAVAKTIRGFFKAFHTLL